MRYLALAADYDGTLAQDGHVDSDTLSAVEALQKTGRKLILVTGRQLPELRSAFPQLALCDAVVAENGGLLYWPAENREEVRGQPPPESFIAEMTRLNVKPFSVGRVVFAAWRPHEVPILQTVQRLRLGYQVIFNKRAVMVLPSSVNKATGLLAVLERMKILPQQVVGVGDAENDHAFLEVCGARAAVANALPALKERCHLVTIGDHGRGVAELIARVLKDDLQDLSADTRRGPSLAPEAGRGPLAQA